MSKPYRVTISGEIDLDPAKIHQALIDAQPLIAAALAEKGCVHYAWSLDPAKPGRMHVFEEWDSEADLCAHLAAEPYQQMSAHLSTVGLLGAVTRKYRVDHVEPVYDDQGRPRGDFFNVT